jgi:hypothetical protein
MFFDRAWGQIDPEVGQFPRFGRDFSGLRSGFSGRKIEDNPPIAARDLN